MRKYVSKVGRGFTKLLIIVTQLYKTLGEINGEIFSCNPKYTTVEIFITDRRI